MHTAELCFGYDSPETAALIASAVSQEIGEIDGDRAAARLSQEATQISIEIDADDLVALRAGLNTWSTLVEVAEKTIEARSERTLRT